MKKLVLFIFLFTSVCEINAQSNKRFAVNLGYGSHGPIIGLYYTQPISNRLAISISSAYSSPNKLTESDLGNISVPNLDEIYEISSGTEFGIFKLDLSYRISSTQPINLYMGYGIEAFYGLDYFTPLGVSYAKRNFVFYTEVSSYWREYEYEYSYYYTSSWDGETYYSTDYNSDFKAFTGLNYGIRYYFK